MPPRKDKGKQRATYVQVDPSDSDNNQSDFERDILAAVQESRQQRERYTGESLPFAGPSTAVAPPGSSAHTQRTPAHPPSTLSPAAGPSTTVVPPVSSARTPGTPGTSAHATSKLSPAQLILFKKKEKQKRLQEEQAKKEATKQSSRKRRKRKQTEKEKEVKRRRKKSGRNIFEQEIRNVTPKVTRCSWCVKRRNYDHVNNPHTSRRSHKCPDHKESPHERLDRLLGEDRSAFIRKIGLDAVLKLTTQKKEQFKSCVNTLADLWREVAIKSQTLAHYYNLDTLNSNRPVPPIAFSQAFFYAAIQLVMGKTISSPNAKVPRDDMDRCYQEMVTEFPGITVNNIPPGFMHSMTYLAIQSATGFRNSIVELFESRVIKYFQFKILDAIPNFTKANAGKVAEYVYDHYNSPATPVNWPESIEQTQELIAVVDNLKDSFATVSKPVNEKTLTARPEEYFAYLYVILQDIERYNSGQLGRVGEVQTEPSKRWAYGVTKDLPESDVLNRRYRSRLVRRIVDAVTESSPAQSLVADRLSPPSLVWLNTIINETREQIRCSIRYQRGETDVQIEDCFRPELATFAQQQRVFSLVLTYHFRRQYVTIDTQTLRTILHRINFPLPPPVQADRSFADIFNFRKIRYDSHNEDLQEPKELFTNVVRTDGYAIDFVFARRKYEALPNLTMDDFTTDKLQGTFQLWGADPGMTEVFVASDGHDENPHQVRKFSTDEFYTVAGFKKTNSKVLNLKRRITILAQSVQEVESGLSGRKTSDKAIFIEHLRNWLPTLHLLLNFYDERFCALRFLNYIGKQRAEAEIVDIFLDGGKKYNKRGTKTKRRNQEKDRKTKKKKKKKKSRRGKRRKKEIQPHPRRDGKWRKAQHNPVSRFPLVAFGDAVFRNSMRGKLTGLANRCRQLLRRAEHQGLLAIADMPEYNTSKMCFRCQLKTLEQLRLHVNGEDQTMHSVQLCTTCRTLWQRDVNASKNMHWIASVLADGQERPSIFCP